LRRRIKTKERKEEGLTNGRPWFTNTQHTFHVIALQLHSSLISGYKEKERYYEK
jgi:hypothetical protein